MLVLLDVYLFCLSCLLIEKVMLHRISKRLCLTRDNHFDLNIKKNISRIIIIIANDTVPIFYLRIFCRLIQIESKVRLQQLKVICTTQ